MILEERQGPTILNMQAANGNAFSADFLEQFNQLLDRYEENRGNGLIITGKGSIFSAGLNLPELIGFKRPEMKSFMQYFERTMMRVFMLDGPVFMAVNGHAIAGGMVLAMLGDQVFGIEEKCQLSLKEAELGIGLPQSVIQSFNYRVSRKEWFRMAYHSHTYSCRELLDLGCIEAVVTRENLIQLAVDELIKIPKERNKAFSQIKRASKQQYFDLFNQLSETSLEHWLDTWFADSAQKLIQEQVDRLKARS
jgi:enoyl-CoA hydratase